jgi:hypothetical protein
MLISAVSLRGMLNMSVPSEFVRTCKFILEGRDSSRKMVSLFLWYWGRRESDVEDEGAGLAMSA